jgi:hypothetical protein
MTIDIWGSLVQIAVWYTLIRLTTAVGNCQGKVQMRRLLYEAAKVVAAKVQEPDTDPAAVGVAVHTLTEAAKKVEDTIMRDHPVLMWWITRGKND